MPDNTKELSKPLAAYINYFNEHQTWVKAHLSGQTDPLRPLPPGVYKPSSYWTSEEKDAFFHALAIHSRLRPDLIAESIKTKNVLDVVAYIRALEDALEETNPRDQVDTFVGLSGTQGGLATPLSAIRKDLPIALDASRQLIEKEHALAEELASLEDSIPFSPPEEGEGEGEGDVNSADGTGSSKQAHSFSFVSKRVSQASATKALDPPTLTVMESLIKERLNGQTPSTSRPTTPPGLAEDPSSVLSTSGTDVQLRRRIQKRLYMRRKRAEAAGKELVLDEDKLKPGRRPKNRAPPKVRPKTYKRELVPEGADDDDDDEGGDDDVGVDNDGAQTSEAKPAEEENKGVDEDEAHPPKGGMTRPYKIRKLFQESDITGQCLMDENLDFFQLSAVGRLISSLSSPNAAITPETLNALRIMVTEYTSTLVERVVAFKILEEAMKGSKKCWKYDPNKVTEANVRDVLRASDMENLSPLSTPDPESHRALEDSEESDEESLSDMQGQEPGKAANDSWLKREPSTSISVDSHYGWGYPTEELGRIYDREPLLPEETDEEELEIELAEEQELDAIDMQASREEMERIWKDNRALFAKSVVRSSRVTRSST